MVLFANISHNVYLSAVYHYFALVNTSEFASELNSWGGLQIP